MMDNTMANRRVWLCTALPLLFFATIEHAMATTDLPVNALASQNDITVLASNLEFDPSFFEGTTGEITDISRFANGSAASPGTYNVAIYINDILISNRTVTFQKHADGTVLPCFDNKLISQLPLNFEKMRYTAEAQCTDLATDIPGAVVYFDSNEQHLRLSIPQIYLQRTARGSVSPELWDSGVPAFMLGYNVNGYVSQSNGVEYQSAYAALNAGLNLGSWYLRHNGNFNYSNGQKTYTSLNTYLQHDLTSLKGRLIVGQANTSGIIFDTLPFTGVQLSSDERMLASSQRGYAPEIRGIARTNARVTVSQSGQTIYETTVSPGAFLIDDLYPTGYGGDLLVTVREADNSESQFTVPFSSVTQLLRPGLSRYSLVAGKLHNSSFSDEPALYQATWQRGLTNMLTGYTGVQASESYTAGQLGMALGTSWGAFSVDVTHARASLPAGQADMSGESYRVSYNKILPESGSNLTLAAYRFSTEGYLDYLTAASLRDSAYGSTGLTTIKRAKRRATLTASQTLPDGYGQLYISGSLQDYWNSNGTDRQYQLGYSRQSGSFSWGLSVNRTFNSTGTSQNTYMASVSFPFGGSTKYRTPVQTRLQYTQNSDGRHSEQLSLSGSAGERREMSWSAAFSQSNQGAGATGALNAQYRSPYATLSAGYSQGKNYRSESAGVGGALVIHSGGMTLSPYSSDTYALVEAKGAEGASVSSYPGIRIDSRGYALVPYLTPYQLNAIQLEAPKENENVELDSTEQKVVPLSGAVVKTTFKTRSGLPVLITATYRGEPVPFGADVTDSQGNSVGAVGQGGQIYARVEQDTGPLRVVWGNGASSQCEVRYRLPPSAKGQKNQTMQFFNSDCQ